MSFASGFKVGFGAVNQAFDEREKRKLREGLKRAGQLEQETVGRRREATPEEFARARDYTQSIAAQDAATFGLGTEAEMGTYAPAAPSGPVTTPQYRLGGLTRETQFSPTEVNQARTEEMARVYEQQGMPEEAMRMRQLAQQQQLTGLQLQTAQRQQEFDTALQDVNKQKFEKPEDRTAAILDVYRIYDPRGAAQLEASYTQNELNKITVKAKTFEQNYKEARAKGVDAVINWYDSVNDGFDLRREGNVVYRKDAATGQETVFLRGTDRELMSQLDAYATPGGFLNLAKTEAEIKAKEAQAKQATATAAYLDRDRPRAGLTAQPEIKETDIRAYLEMYGDIVVGQGDNRRPITLNQLPPAEQRAYILQIIRGQAGTEGLPDIGEGGLQPRAATQPARGATDARGLGTLGRFTPQELLERAAAAGNQSAIEELRRRQEAESARGLVPYTPFSF
jgi:hypothetical protein